MLGGSVEEAPREQQPSYFTEDLDQELRASNRNLQRSKNRLRKANNELQLLFDKLQVASGILEQQNTLVRAARRNVVSITSEKDDHRKSKRAALHTPPSTLDLPFAMKSSLGHSGDSGKSEHQQLLQHHSDRLDDAHDVLQRALVEQVDAAEKQAALQKRLAAVNASILAANSDVQRCYKAVHNARRYEMMLARQDCREISDAYATLLGRTPGKHWRTDEEALAARKEREREEAEATMVEEAATAVEDERISVARQRLACPRSALASAVVRPPAVPPLALPLVHPAPRSTAETDRPWPCRGPSSIGPGLTPRIVCKGVMAGAPIGKIAFNKGVLPAAVVPPVSSVVPLPALPTAKRRVPSALAHQPMPWTFQH